MNRTSKILNQLTNNSTENARQLLLQALQQLDASGNDQPTSPAKQGKRKTTREEHLRIINQKWNKKYL